MLDLVWYGRVHSNADGNDDTGDDDDGNDEKKKTHLGIDLHKKKLKKNLQKNTKKGVLNVYIADSLKKS